MLDLILAFTRSFRAWQNVLDTWLTSMAQVTQTQFWGGFKYFGIGREYCYYGIDASLETRAILE